MLKKKPIRSCVCCKNAKSKSDLIRIIKIKDDIIEVDSSQKKNGRGAYVCKDEKCINSKKLKSNIERALKMQNAKFEKILESIREEASLGE